MIAEVKSLEPQLKQILYGCVEHVQATKAALYLSASHDLNDKRYELVTSYQYNPADRKSVSGNDDLVDRLVVKRSPFFVNGLGTDMRFSEMLFRQGNDLEAAKAIADQVLSLLGAKQLFGIAPLPLAETEPPKPAGNISGAFHASAQTAATPERARGELSPRAQN